ncbi:MAG TPA: cysteine desulfurase [Ruminococcaceae bacterium]|nr:cysteine desulfurase [Oscillospiraceae bacterium]
MIYLDNAATTYPKPQAVGKAYMQALTRYSANPGRSGHKMSQATAEKIYECRKNVADFFGSSHPEHVVFTLNCTQAINYVLKGLLKQGARVVTSSFEHNAVMRPLNEMARREKVLYEAAAVSLTNPDETFRAFEGAVIKGTAAVVVTHASNVCGIRLPIEKIGRLCRERGVPLIVDAAQSAGIFPIDMEKMHIDYLCVAAHKGLYAPMGNGILIADGKPLSTIIEGGTGTASIDFNQPSELPERFESGTVNAPGIIALAAGLEFVKSKGTENIYRHEIGLIRYLYKKLQKIEGVKFYHALPEEQRFAPVLSFNVGEQSSVRTAAMLDRADIAVRAGLHCAPTAHRILGTIEQGTVRICPSAFTSYADMDRTAAAVEQIAKKV